MPIRFNGAFAHEHLRCRGPWRRHRRSGVRAGRFALGGDARHRAGSWSGRRQGATAAGMGHIVVMDDSEAQFALTRYSQTLWDELSPRFGGRLRIRGRRAPCGLPPMMKRWRRCMRSTLIIGHAALRPGFSMRRPSPTPSRTFVPVSSAVCVFPATALFIHRARPVGFCKTPSTAAPACKSARGRAIIDEQKIMLRDGTIPVVRAPSSMCARGSARGRRTLRRPSCQIRPRKGHLVITDRYPGFLTHQIVELGYLKSAHGSDGDSVAFNLQPPHDGASSCSARRGSSMSSTRTSSCGCLQHADRACAGIHAWFGPAVGHSRLDGVSRGDAGFVAVDRAVAGQGRAPGGGGARRAGHHDFARHRGVDRVPSDGTTVGDSRGGLFAGPIRRRERPCLSGFR